MTLIQKLIPVFIFLTVAGLGAAGYFYWQFTKAQAEIQTIRDDPSTLQKAAQQEVAKLVEEVGRLIALPEGEEPTVATITDIEKLKDQPFFARAKNGDKVLIFTNAKKAILYDPVAKKIIDVAPVNIGTPSAQTATGKVFVRTATSSATVANTIEADIKKNFTQITLVGRETVTSPDYETSVVVVLNDATKNAADAMSKALGIPVGPLPAGETRPNNTDILLIVGKDKL